MKKLLTCFLCVGFAALAYAQEAAAPAPAEEDVVYLKDGGVLRGEIVGATKTTGRIQLRDGSIFVYKKANIKMASKEPVSESNAREDSLKMVMITKNVIEQENQKRRQEAELQALQKMIDANRKDTKKEEGEGSGGGGFRMYSALEVLGGIGVESLPQVDTAAAADNKQRIVGFHYAIGGRTDYFFIGFNMGLYQTHRNMSPMASLMAGDTIPATLISLPVGLDMRVEFVPQGALSPYLGISGAYALSLTEGVNDYMIINPSFGLRFGRNKVSSLISGGYQLNIDGGNVTHYVTLRLGFIF
jgi:hypothetical protein